MKRLLLSIAILLLSRAVGQADLVIVLDNPSQTGVAGDKLTFNGVITNLAAQNEVELNSFSLDLTGDDFGVDGLAPFLNNVPLFLAAGASSEDIPLFTVSINYPLTDPLGTWEGVYTLLGGSDGNAQDILGQVTFTVTTNVPEPGTFPLFGIGFVLLVLCHRSLAAVRVRGLHPGSGIAL